MKRFLTILAFSVLGSLVLTSVAAARPPLSEDRAEFFTANLAYGDYMDLYNGCVSESCTADDYSGSCSERKSRGAWFCAEAIWGTYYDGYNRAYDVTCTQEGTTKYRHPGRYRRSQPHLHVRPVGLLRDCQADHGRRANPSADGRSLPE